MRCIQNICQQTKKAVRVENSEIAPAVSFAEDLFSTKHTETSFTKAVYMTPNLTEVAKCNGTKLAPARWALLLSTLVKKNRPFFKPVGIKQKPT